MSVYANIEPLSWESNFFHRSCARLVIENSAPILTTTELDHYDVVQIKVPASDLQLLDRLADFSFQLAEGEVDFVLDLQSTVVQPLAMDREVISAEPHHIPLLREAASTVFQFSRFRSPWFLAQDSGKFYAHWVEQAVKGSFDHCCLILQNNQSVPLGFVTLRQLEQSEARIGLLAVWPQCTEKGIGSLLMNIAKQWCQVNNICRLRVATQMGNLAALRLYMRHGAIITNSAYWLYRGKP